MGNFFAGIVITVLIAVGIELIKPEITKLRVLIRRKPFETTVITMIGILIVISFYGTFL